MSIYPCSTHVDPITSVAVYIPIAAEIKHVAWLYQGYIPPCPTISHHVAEFDHVGYISILALLPVPRHVCN